MSFSRVKSSAARLEVSDAAEHALYMREVSGRLLWGRRHCLPSVSMISEDGGRGWLSWQTPLSPSTHSGN